MYWDESELERVLTWQQDEIIISKLVIVSSCHKADKLDDQTCMSEMIDGYHSRVF